MPRLDFEPLRHGYHFPNTFTTRVLPGVLNGVTTSGLCGGMAMSALDYWLARVPIPAHTPPDFGAGGLPSEASAMRRYIFDRQMNTFLTRLMVTRWITAPWITPDDFHAWAVGSEFEIVKNQIHMGRPALLGLWSMQAGNPVGGHQVLCYGYENAPRQLYIYDPNRPDEESVLTPVSPVEGCVIRGTRTPGSSPYRGYFFTDVYNWAENPPYDPRYKDLVVTSPFSLSPEDPDNPLVGRRLGCSVTVTNVGEYPSRFKHLFVWVRGPRGENLDRALGGAEPGITVLQPGESRTITRTANAFGTEPGTYSVGVSYLSIQDQWIPIPPGATGFASSAQIALWPRRTVAHDVWVDVPESLRGDLHTGVVLRPGDEFQLTGSGMIWAGVWFTGLNGPEGWTDRIESNPASPMHGVPDAHPFSLVGRFGSQPYFYVGRGTPRRPAFLSSPTELCLRTNDNSPGNGSGSFRCRIQVWR